MHQNGIDLNRAMKIIEDYRHATGMHCILMDADGHPVSQSKEEESDRFCGMCTDISCNPGNGHGCREFHLYGAYQAERFGGRYMYFCRASLLFWSTPIILDGMMQGALTGGPALLITPEEALEELRRTTSVDKASAEALKEKLNTIPKITPRQGEALLEMLFLAARGIYEAGPSETPSHEAGYRQQSRIGEYIHHLKSMGGDESRFTAYPVEKEKALQARIARGDREGAREILNEILGSVLCAAGGDLEVMKARVLELTVLLSRAAMEGGANVEQIFGLNYKFLNKIREFEDLDELFNWLNRILGRFSDFVFSFKEIKHTDVIYKSFDYIRSHLSEKITLEEVAEYVYLSPTYFSKVFKEEIGIPFSAYINQQRIEKSKELLGNSRLTLVEIAGLVGFDDQSYFNKVFKKQTGLSPGRYREKNKKLFLDNPEIHD